ncbi:hypothetical protein DFR86_03610 [Acidianus sulfidivorans JP7]|uniref:Uncharacterized protein n=1 Tax=Acidianus sulfidivorans JP7 TaxID=619593 RepID=A0A2U9IL41_9CREN|nr:hypothetical protein [Acidianus sulfidivorans]AWR96730.1 hypothetical protein DFR86_03610 [Acidianus sulfidivorans JP7]
MLSYVTKLPIDDIEFIKSWFKEKKNILDCIPNIQQLEENEVIINRGILREKLKFKLYTISNENYVEHKLMGDCTIRIILLPPDREIRIIYEGNDKAMEKVLNDFLEKMKNNILKSFKEKLEEDLNSQKNSLNNSISENLGKISFIIKLTSSSKILLEEVKNISDLTEYVEDLVLRFGNYPVLYIRGIGKESFRILLVNRELKGVYLRNSENKVSFNELDLVNLSGEYNIRVYGSMLNFYNIWHTSNSR